MAHLRVTVNEMEVKEPIDYHAQQVGQIAAIDDDGRALVVFPGELLVPTLARSLVDAAPAVADAPDALVGVDVLLCFENADPRRPIILGVLREQLQPEPRREELELKLDKNHDILVDGETLTFDAKKEIVLRCGKSTLFLSSSGKVLIRGKEVLSRASARNRIKGGSVSIN